MVAHEWHRSLDPANCHPGEVMDAGPRAELLIGVPEMRSESVGRPRPPMPPMLNSMRSVGRAPAPAVPRPLQRTKHERGQWLGARPATRYSILNTRAALPPSHFSLTESF